MLSAWRLDLVSPSDATEERGRGRASASRLGDRSSYLLRAFVRRLLGASPSHCSAYSMAMS